MELKDKISYITELVNEISKENLFKSLDELNEYEFVSPHNKLIDLEPIENGLENEKIFEIKRHFRGEFDHQKMPMCGGTTIFKKESLEKIGGWPEPCTQFWVCNKGAKSSKIIK